MGLRSSREKALEQITLCKDLVNENTVLPYLKQWLQALKIWEQKETFERAFSDNRMCVRAAPQDNATQMKQSFTPRPHVQNKQNDVLIRASVPHIPLYQNPQNFLTKKKNELGLHDVSAVLLYGDKPISKQVFPKVARQQIFIPLPQEADLQLFYQIELLAKQKKAGPIYEFYKNARAIITRIKYGSEDDMKTTFLKTVDDQQKVHYRYGDAHETTGPVTAELLKQRRLNALSYKSLVLTGKITENNEVTLKIRQHAGSWPQAAFAGPLPQDKFIPYDIPDKHYLLIGFDGKFKGMINDQGKLIKN